MLFQLLVIAALGGGLAWLGWASSAEDAVERPDPEAEAWEDLVGRLRD
jgi:hypothetical protein